MKLRSWLLPADSNHTVYPVLQAVEKDEGRRELWEVGPPPPFFFFFKDKVSIRSSSAWPQIQFIVLRTQIPECWDYRHVSPQAWKIEKNFGVIMGFNCITQGYR